MNQIISAQKIALKNINDDLKKVTFQEKKLSESIEYGFEDSMTNKAYLGLYNAIKRLSKTMNATSEVFASGSSSNSYGTKTVDCNVDVEELQDSILHIKFDILLPLKVYYMVSATHQVAQEGVRKYIRPNVHEALEHYAEKNQFPIYNGRVVFYIRHTYSSRNNMRDNDNFELKQTIDDIQPYILPDDSPIHCSLYSEGRVGESTYSEIFVIPESIFSLETCHSL